MSRLYVRLMTGFYSHRKTLRLRARLGNDAYWLPPRIWAYCAENQPDGDLSSYSAEEISELVAYKGDAQAMLGALKDCGFMDLDGSIHGWDEHNGFHSIFSKRAKAAAEARWGKKEKKQKKEVQEKEKEPSICASNATSIISDPLPIPDKLKTQPFMLKWNQWMTYRRGFKRVKDWAALFREQLDFLSRYESNVAVEILSSSMRNGYQGLFEPKNNSNGHSTTKPNPRNNGITIGPTDFAAAAARRQQEQAERIRQKGLVGQTPTNGTVSPAA